MTEQTCSGPGCCTRQNPLVRRTLHDVTPHRRPGTLLLRATWIVLLIVATMSGARAAEYSVTNLNDSGAGSLREGLTAASSGACAAPCTITFAVAGEIVVSSDLPPITAAGVTLDGFTATGAVANSAPFGLPSNANLAVTLRGAGCVISPCPPPPLGIHFAQGSSGGTVRGLVLAHFPYGISLEGSGHTVSGNYIGTDASGMVAASNQDAGVFIGAASNCTIGGETPADLNVISGTSGGPGVIGSAMAGSGNRIVGNYIGTNAGATGAIPNDIGIRIFGFSPVTVGSTTAPTGMANIISGNVHFGIQVEQSPAVIAGNSVGLDGSGTLAIPNGTDSLSSMRDGIWIRADDTLVQNNVVSGNFGNGITVSNSTATLQQNRVGLQRVDFLPIPNGAGSADPAAIVLFGATGSSVFGNDVAGQEPPFGTGIAVLESRQVLVRSNRLLGTFYGVVVDGLQADSSGTAIYGNSFTSIGSMPIDLRAFGDIIGPTPNDPGDADGGNGYGNNFQNYPEITAALYRGTGLPIDVHVSVDSTQSLNPAGSILVQVSALNTGGNPIAVGAPVASRCFAGSQILDGIVSIPAGTSGVGPGTELTATATAFKFDNPACDLAVNRIGDGTSEFAPPVAVLQSPGVVTNTNDSGPGSLHQAIQDANSGQVCPSPCTIVFDIPGPVPVDGYYTIRPTAALPLVVTTSNVTIDGTTQATNLGVTSSTPLIVVDGSFAGALADGIRIGSAGAGISGVTVRGLGVQNFSGNGINVTSDTYAVDGVRIAGNFLGVTPAGTAAPNGVGLRFGSTASFATIGMNPSLPAVADRNVISGNTTAGIVTQTSYSQFFGNYVGTNPAGTAAVPNGAGIIVDSGGYMTMIGMVDTPNLIAYNTGAAITLGSTAAGVTIVANSIHSNGFGIDLLPGAGPTPNDAGDVDTGGNGLQNFPLITSKSFDGTNTTVTGSLSTTAVAGYTYRIDFYANSLPDPSGYGQGETYLGRVDVTPDATGNAAFTAVLPGDLTAKYLTATAAMSGAPAGMAGWTAQTSEFSQLAEADVAITIADSPDPVLAGGTITYDLTLSNAGPAAAADVSFTITFDTNTTGGSVTPPNGWACLGPPAIFPPPDPPPPLYVTCTGMSALAAGSFRTFQATAVAPPASGVVTTTAAATSGNPDPDPTGNGPIAAATAVQTVAALSVAGTDAPDPVDAGGTIAYQIVVTNAGPTSAEGVTLSIGFPEATSAAVTPPTGWTCIAAIADPPPGLVGVWAPPHSYSCFPQTTLLAPGSHDFTASASPAATGGSYSVSVSVATTSVDADTSDNAVTIVTAIQPVADLSVSKSNGVAAQIAGGATTYTITVFNAGPSAAAGATVADALPAAFTAASWNCSAAPGSACSAASGSGAINTTVDVAVGGTVTYDLTATLAPTATGSVTNTASVTPPAGIADRNPENNSSTDTDSIGIEADLALSRSGGSPIVAGTTLEYTLRVANGGPSFVNGVRLVDTLSYASAPQPGTDASRRRVPAGHALDGQSWSCVAAPASSCRVASGSGDADVLLDLAPGGWIDIKVSAPIPAIASGFLRDTTLLLLPPGVADPTPSDNASIVSEAITQSADLTITKNASEATVRAGETVTYALLVSNYGPSNVSGARIVDEIPASLPSAQWTCIAGQGAVCQTLQGGGSIDALVDLPSGTQVLFTLGATLDVAATGTLLNSASVILPGTISDPDMSGNTATASSTIIACPSPPQPAAPVGATIDDPVNVTFSWSDVGATSYEVFVATGGEFVSLGTSQTTTLTAPLDGGAITWYVVAISGNCRIAGPQASFIVRVCLAPETPIPYLLGEVNSDERFTYSWATEDEDVSFEYRTAERPEFGDSAWIAWSDRSVTFIYQNAALQPAEYWFQVRAVRQCPQGPRYSENSAPMRIVILPAGTGNDSATVEEGQDGLVNQLLRLCPTPEGGVVVCNDPGSAAKSLVALNTVVTITTDKGWMSVTPSTTTVPPGGTTVTVTSNPQGLPTGTNTGSVVVTASGGNTSNVPFSVNIVTPVSPQPKTPPLDALIIPAVAHADGINSRWQSDIRVTNIGSHARRYALSFTPSGTDGSVVGKKTELEIRPGETKALDDVVKQWYGLGSFGDGTTGVLEIRPAEAPKHAAAHGVEDFSTIASSRTYNATPTGTYGQWIPAVPLARFVGLAGSGALTMQQIAQSERYRTNLGVVEGSGAPATVLFSIVDPAGKEVTNFSVDLKAMEHKQLNGFLAERGIELEEGRIEAKVTGGEGRITTYASVIDAHTNDPLLVPGVDASTLMADRFVLPGVAHLDTGTNRWRSDVRIFNPGGAAIDVQLVFFAQNDPGSTRTAQVSIAPRAIAVLDDVVTSLFGLTAMGGAIHVVPPSAAPLVVSGRTYDQQESGTYGQFIAAVTEDDAVGVSDRALEILQIEQSDRYRTNLGLVEVSGKEVTVEISAAVPLSTVVPKLRVTLQPNGFTQLPSVLQQMNLGVVYNGRLSVKVVSGEGQVSAYASVIDQQTQDPTYVPAQ